MYFAFVSFVLIKVLMPLLIKLPYIIYVLTLTLIVKKATLWLVHLETFRLKLNFSKFSLTIRYNLLITLVFFYLNKQLIWFLFSKDNSLHCRNDSNYRNVTSLNERIKAVTTYLAGR